MVHMDQPELYSKSNASVEEESSRVLDTFSNLLKWKSNQSIIDIGIGDGKYTVENLIPRIPKPFKKFVGVDISESMLNFAKENYTYPNVEYELFDVGSKNIPSEYENEFDHVFSFFCLSMLDDQRQCFINIYNMLKPGGHFLVTFSLKFPWADTYKGLANNARWSQYINKGPGFRYYGIKEPEKKLLEDLINIGFEIDVCQVEKSSFTIPNYEEFRDLSLSLTPDLSKIPSEDKGDFMDDYLNTLISNDQWVTIKDGPNNKKTYQVHYDLVAVVGLKPIS